MFRELVKKYKLLKKKNVLGWSESFLPREKDGELVEGTRVFRVYVTKKEPLEVLSERDIVPPVLEYAGEKVETDVVEIGPQYSLGTPQEAQQKHRPVVAGISAMGYWKGSTACTLGGFAVNKKKGESSFLGAIGNNHCTAHENKAKLGTYYLQPSPYDGGTLGDAIGTLHRYVPLKFEKYKCPYRNLFYYIFKLFRDIPFNTVDIGFIRLYNRIPKELVALNVPRVKGKRSVKVGEKVQGVGRTSGHKVNGTVIDTNFVGRVVMSRGTALFRDCVLVVGKDYSGPGDSGRPEFTMDGYYYGNLFAGGKMPTGDTTSIICKYQNIERELEVEILW